jgi:hypothetical protein
MPLYALHDALTQHAQLAAGWACAVQRAQRAPASPAGGPSRADALRSFRRASSASLSGAASARTRSPRGGDCCALDDYTGARAAVAEPRDAHSRAPARRNGPPQRADADADGFVELPSRRQRSLSCDSSASASSYASTALASPRWAASKPAAKPARWQQQRRRAPGRAAKPRTDGAWRRETLAPLADWEA